MGKGLNVMHFTMHAAYLLLNEEFRAFLQRKQNLNTDINSQPSIHRRTKNLFLSTNIKEIINSIDYPFYWCKFVGIVQINGWEISCRRGLVSPITMHGFSAAFISVMTYKNWILMAVLIGHIRNEGQWAKSEYKEAKNVGLGMQNAWHDIWAIFPCLQSTFRLFSQSYYKTILHPFEDFQFATICLIILQLFFSVKANVAFSITKQQKQLSFFEGDCWHYKCFVIAYHASDSRALLSLQDLFDKSLSKLFPNASYMKVRPL